MNNLISKFAKKIRPEINFCLFKQVITNQINSPNTWSNLKECDVLLVCHDNDRGYTYKGQAYAQLLDSLGDLLILNNIKTESIGSPYSILDGAKAYNEPASINIDLIKINIQRRILRLLKNRGDVELWFTAQYINTWKKVLIKCKAKAVIGIQPHPYLCRACSTLNIPIYDLLHGIFDSKEKYYKNAKMNLQDSPTGFLCWNLQHKKVIEEIDYGPNISTYLVGNLWFRRFLQEDSRDLLVKEALHLPKIFSNRRPSILVSLQWGMKEFSPEYVPNGVMPESLMQAIEQTYKIYNWHIRLHPVQIRSEKKSSALIFLKKNFSKYETVEWCKTSEYPLPVILKYCDLHLTYNSSITVEAGWMGICTGLLDPTIHVSNYFEYERSLGIAESVSLDANEIKKWIEINLKKDKPPSTLENCEKGLQDFIAYVNNIYK